MEETGYLELQKLKRTAQNEGNNRLLVSTCADLSDVYMKSGRFQQAIEEFKTLAEVYKLEHNQIEYGKANRAIGEAYLGLHNFKKALKHQKIYFNIAASEKNNEEIQRAYATIGHIYLTTYLETQADADHNLNAAYKYFMRSMEVCESLSAINPLEKADMQARLFSNMGLVKMSLENYDTAIELFTTSINICRTNNIYEQLSRGYMSLATLYIKKGDTIKSMHQYNLAIEAAKKLKDNIDLMCTVLHTKAEDLIKLGDFHAAKKTLKKAYKLNSPNLEDRKIIEKYFRAVTTMCSAEDKLVVETNNRDLKKLYETMGDCACVVKNYPKAIEYYKLMLNYAELSGVSGKELATCYNSLAQTYEDNQMFKEAVQYFEKEFELMDNIKDALDAMSKIADNKESAEESMGDVVEVYDKAIKYCQEKNNLKEERRMIARCIKYLQRIGKTSEACSYQQKLNALKVPDKEDDSSSSECESHNSSIMDDKENCDNLDDITANSPLRQSPGPSLFNEYQEIMKNLARKPSTSKQSDVTSNVRKMPALLREKNVSFDDWLEDDLQPSKATKKQKTSLTESGVTSSTRKRSLDSPRSNTPKKRSSPSPTRRVFRPSNIQKNSAKRKIQTSLKDSSNSKTINNVKHKPPQTLQRHRSLEHVKQSKTTTFERSKSSIEPSSTMSSPNKFSYTQIPIAQDNTPNILVANAISTGDLMVFVDVKVEDKVFRVPVLLAQVQTNTIGWLAEQAALKYARMLCSKPQLELETTTGALLSDEDPLSLLFPLGTTQAEPVVGKIVRRFETPLVDRYRDACLHMKEDVDDKLTRILEEFSVNLNLQNLGIMSHTLSPLCKALNHQTTLLDLNLSGNFLDVYCMVILCSSLPSLVNLTSLNLKCTGLSGSHLTEMVNMFSVASTRILQRLKRLDLSNNYLRNRSCELLVEILRHLKLEHLNIANVTFNSGIFQDLHNRNLRLNLQDVKYLNISNNQLSSRDVENIISWTVANNLVDLNLSRNTLKNTTLGHFSEDFDRDGKFNSLHSLNLSRCGLTDTDMYHILRLCSNKSIIKIDASYNIDLTAITLRRILELPVLEDINLIGCDNILKYFSEFYKEVTESCRRKCIKLTVDFKIYYSEVDSLIENFKKLHTEPVIDKGERLLIIHTKEWEK